MNDVHREPKRFVPVAVPVPQLLHMTAFSVAAKSLLAGQEEPEDAATEEPVDPAEQITTELEGHVPEEFEQLISDSGPLMGLLLGVGISIIVAIFVTLVTSSIIKQIFRKTPSVKRAVNRTRIPLFILVLMAGSALSVRFLTGEHWWQDPLYVALLAGLIVSVAWWALRVVKIVEAVVLAKYIGEATPGLEDRRGRRVQTQVNLIGRILAAVIITLAVAAVLLLNESVRGLGAGLLASAGVVSVVAGLAMQSTLSNVIAGIQLAFTDNIRVGDVVVIEDNFGTVEEITLSTVVLKSWDERRFIYPSAYFVGTPFQNWTRVGTQIMGTVELDVDWRIPVDDLRRRLKRLLQGTDLWDGQSYSIQVSDATGGIAKAWVVVSARNSGELWDLRCLVREDLVNYVRSHHPYAMLTQRMLISNEEALSQDTVSVDTGSFGAVDAEDGDTTRNTEDSSLFTGSIEAVERNRDFAGPGEDAYRERRERADEDYGGEEQSVKD